MPVERRSKRFYLKACGTKLTAEWYNLRKKRKGLGGDVAKQNETIKYLYDKAMELCDEETKIKAQKLFDFIKDSPEFVALADWNPCLSPDVFIQYRCAKCKMAPLKQCSWFRCVQPCDAENQDGTMSVRGDWRCAAKYMSTAWDTGAGACLRIGAMAMAMAGCS